MPKGTATRIAILGAGPIGLEAALQARELQFSVTVYERGRAAEYWRRWGHVRLFSPFGMNTTPLGRAAILADNPKHTFPAADACITGHEHVTQYLEPLGRCARLRECIRAETQVLYVGKRGLLKGDSERAQAPFRLLIRKSKERETVEEADVVLDCTGTYGQHRWLGDGGIPCPGELAAEPHIAYGLEDILGERRAVYAGKTTIVIGGGYSAATTVSRLATLSENQPETWVVWLARGGSTQPIKRLANDPLRERDRLAVRANTLATRGEGNVEFHNRSVVESLDFAGPDKPIRVHARCNGQPRTWEAERLIANVGYTPDNNLYRELQVHECYASLGPMALAAALSKHAGADCLQVPAHGPASLANPEPNFFILGAKSYGRNPHFLLRIGFEQVRDVFKAVGSRQ